MNMKKSLFALPIALGAGLMLSTPASAANHNNGNQLRAEIRQLDRQIDRAPGLSNREEARLERRVDNLQTFQRRFARNGYNRGELKVLNNRISAIRADLRTEARDGDRRRR